MVQSFVLINTEPGVEAEAAERLRKMENVREVYLVFGVYSLLVKVDAHSLEELKNSSSNIRQLNMVRNTLTVTVVEEGAG
jgi:DNA-binding Lrp family transcriptional regulator